MYFSFHTSKAGFAYMGQNTLSTSTSLAVKVLVVVHPHLSCPRMTFPNATTSAIIIF